LIIWLRSISFKLPLLYSLFAGIAITINLAAQALVMYFFNSNHAMLPSMLVGTSIGLVTKYILDRRYIFNFKTENLAHDGKLFLIYSVLGVLTTTLFWIIEYGFKWIFDAELMRYIGGAIGLMLGYLIKYHLDKQFVFVNKNPNASKAVEVLI
jgi:putative flippase GtrA